MATWVYDEIGCAGAILDDYCIRNLAGNTVGWVCGLSVFSLKGDHIGWFEDGVFYDIYNDVLGFISGATGLVLELPARASEPAAPPFSKRPTMPTLRGRTARPPGSEWSRFCLTTYLAFSDMPSARAPFMPLRALAGTGRELSR